MRPVTVLGFLFVCGCLGLGRSAEDEAQTPRITVHHRSADEPAVIDWTPPDADWVEVRHVRSGRVVWRIQALVTPRGPTFLRPPLTYGAFAHGPGWSPPPDAAEPHTVVPAEPLAPGEVYTVTVHRVAYEAPGALSSEPRSYEATIRFTASDTIPMERGE